MSEVLPPLRQQLRRGWDTVSGARQVWTGVVADCGSLLDSLGNLAEQMGALDRLRISDTPLRSFPELRERLRFKLLQETDSVLGRLREHICRLQTVRDAISNQVSAVLQVYQQNVDRLDLQTVTQRSAVSPSVADLLEWLQDAERHYRCQYPSRPAGGAGVAAP